MNGDQHSHNHDLGRLAQIPLHHKPPRFTGKTVQKVVEALCRPQSYEKVFYRDTHDVPMPSVAVLNEVMAQLRSILFPGFFGQPDLTPQNMPYYIGSALDNISRLLENQLMSGYCVSCFREEGGYCSDCHNKSRESVEQFIGMLPEIRELLAGDVDAAYIGDPASRGKNEVIFCYPSIKALISHRIAHSLHTLGIPLIPRIITEMAHSETGIDIHPGAVIGERFFIDHGTGTVIGETCIIGRNVRIYQGVTLGARSFPLDENGKPVKGIPRHPIVEDEVVIYAGATILGRITIGKGSVIGGNVWITTDIPPDSQVVQTQPKKIVVQQKKNGFRTEPETDSLS